MTILENHGAAWACTAAGLLLYTAWLCRCLGKGGHLKAGKAWCLLLPAALGLLCAKGGYLLLQWEETLSAFQWCYTTGLLGLIAGTALAARLCGADPLKTLDETAAAACLCMAAARLAQRWLGESGLGPILDSEGFLTMVNDWEEPVLATWMIETFLCLLAGGATALWRRRLPRAVGGTCAGMVHFLLDPQILAEYFRSGDYLRFMMMKLEQAVFAVTGLAVLILLGIRLRRTKPVKALNAFAPAIGYTALAGMIALAEFLLDGKLVDAFPAPISWSMFGMSVAGMIALAVWAVRRVDKAENRGKQP